jgi:hypothetical protein
MDQGCQDVLMAHMQGQEEPNRFPRCESDDLGERDVGIG